MASVSLNYTIPTVLPNPNDNHGPAVVVFPTLTAVVATILVALRFYTRWRILRLLGWEDWLLLVALLFGITNSIIIAQQVNNGMGRHFVYVSSSQFQNLVKCSWLVTVFYSLSLTFTKISILVLYLRILTFHFAQIMTKILLGIVIISQSFIISVVFTSYIPIQSFWDPNIKSVYIHGVVWYYASAGLHMSTDLLICLLPIPVVLRMNVNRRQKIALCLVFMLGLTVVAISAYRFVAVVHVGADVIDDPTWNQVSLAILSALEPNASIVCACLTTLKPLLVNLFPRIFSGRDRPSANSSALYTSRNHPPTIGTRPSRPLMVKVGTSLDRDSVVSWDNLQNSPAVESDVTFPIYSNVSFCDVSKSPAGIGSGDSGETCHMHDLESQISPTKSHNDTGDTCELNWPLNDGDFTHGGLAR